MGAWRWGNVPVPEGHVAALAAGTALQRLRPWRLTGRQALTRPLGWAPLAAGAALGAWAVRASGAEDLAAPEHLIESGPYRWTRNPMYIAWTAASVGLAILGNAAWVLALTPVGAWLADVAVRREEQDLARRFGAEYDAYRSRVPRYL